MALQKKTYHVLFFLVVLLLIFFKWNDFYLPYFWDELGVYSRAAHFQYIHNVSLMPGSVPAELSRGHPLLFTCLNALVAKIFGPGVFVAHVFCFSISCILLLAVYLKAGKYFSPVAGFISAIVLAVQPVFLAQSCLVLPEVTLALFVFMATCSYYEEQFALFALFASLAILTKEAAVVLPITVFAYAVIKWALLKTRPRGLTPVALFSTFIPYAIFGTFLIIQKQQNGWYFFPLHIGFVKFSFVAFLQQILRYISFITECQGRNLITVILIAGGIISLLKWKFSFHAMGRSFILLLLFLTMSLLCFNGLVDFYMDRYAIVLLIPFAICAGAAIVNISDSKYFIVIVIAYLICDSWFNLENGTFQYDADLGYRRSVNSLKQSINYINEIQKPDAQAFGNFPGNFAMFLPEAGYLNQKKLVWHDPNDKDTPYYLLVNSPGDPIEEDTVNSIVVLLKDFTDGYADSKVYYVKKK